MSKVYSLLEYVVCGRALMESRIFHLEKALGLRRILLIGDGNGRFLEALYRRGFKGEVVSIDQSSSMIAQAKKRCAAFSSKVQWIQDDVNAVPLAQLGRFDGLITHYFWDVFEAQKGKALLGRVMSEVRGLHFVGLSDFSSAEELEGWRRLRQGVLLSVLFFSFRIVTGIENRKIWPVEEALNSMGWSNMERNTYGNQLVWSSWWSQDSCIDGVDM